MRCRLAYRQISVLCLCILLSNSHILFATEPEEDRQELLRLHQEVLDAHRNNDLDTWMQGESEDYILVSRGRVSTPDKATRRERIGPYLNSTTFSEYRDLVEPRVRLSEDGTLGWVIAQVRIVGVQQRPDKAPESLDSTWAWIELYEKRQGQWLRIGNVSNVMPKSKGQ